MQRSSFHRWPAFALAGWAVTAAAQVSPAPAPGGWRSAFEGYRPFNEAPVASWREANDTVGRIGGWRAYAREAAQPSLPGAAAGMTPPLAVPPAPARPAVPATRPAPAAAGHPH